MPTRTNTPTITSTPTKTKTPIVTSTPSVTSTQTPSVTVTLSALPTESSTPPPSSTGTPSPTWTESVKPPADLRVTNISNPPPTVEAGGFFRVTDETTNVGSGEAGACVTSYSLVVTLDGGQSGVPLEGARLVPALGPQLGSLGTVAVIVPNTITPGSYYVLACANALGNVPESNTKNDCAVSKTSVTVSAAAAP
jgi:hypothetical protein